MKKNIMDLMKIGVIVPALVLSMAACGNSGSSGTASSAEAPAQEAQAAEATEAAETPEAQPEEEPGVETTYENGGFKMTVPANMANKVIVKVPEKSEDGILFDVSEKASVEAAKAKGNEYDGMGWLYAIGVRDEKEFHQMLCNDMSGEDPIGFDEKGNYYIFFHPTDVRYDRETAEQMEKDMDQWTEACEWANSMKQAFLDENPGLTPFNWNQTVLESYLARTAYDENAVYTISTLEYGPLEAKGVDAEKYFKELTDGATIELYDGEAPDGEYIVLNFAGDDEVRFDFFYAPEGQNLVRQVWGEFEPLYQATYADESKNAHAPMQEWYKALDASI